VRGKGRNDDAMPEPLTISEPVAYQMRVVLRGASGPSREPCRVRRTR
jgi:hypothetical protein